ncbi:MAG TPA: universal stress protein [Allocoleopsis sp.]
MFDKILVAMDNSESGQQIFEEALVLAKATKAQLMLLHVMSPDEEGYPNSLSYTSLDYYPELSDDLMKNYQKQWKRYERLGLKLLHSRVKEAEAEGVNAQFTQTPGNPGRVICQIASDWVTDLIIMGRRGRSGLGEMLLGSVSNYVAHHAPCSILIVQGKVSSDSAAQRDNQTLSSHS